MAKKSIADLERYQEFLNAILRETEVASCQCVFDSGEVDRFNMGEAIAKLEAIRNTLVILDQELTVAMLSNAVSYRGEDFSLYQASCMLAQMENSKKFFERLRNELLDGKATPEIARFQQQTVSMEILNTQIENLFKSLYGLKDKIERQKAKAIIEIDMDSLIPVPLSERGESEAVKGS